ncbi:MAG: ribosomal protein S18-alanine N-acetyltransferase [Hyphomicrobiaceae bacterium]|nr:ribosomal protein S18-alanine N-acetyltransferase [Hyphomicrobiaceae bacterium]
MTAVAGTKLDPKFVSLVWAGPERAGELAEMHAQLFAPAWNQESMLSTLSHPGSTAFLARVRDGAEALPEPAGFIIGQLAADEAEILSVGVLPRFQRRGVGGLLVQGLARAAKRAEAQRLFLEVAADNQAAFALYRSQGFTAVGMRKGYYTRTEGEPQDALVLALTLDR